MDGRGQMLLLSALALCVCLIGLSACLASIREAESPESPWLGKDGLDNLIWAQDAGLEERSDLIGPCPWEQRGQLARDYSSEAQKLINDISAHALAHGLAFCFVFNESLAEKHLDENHLPGVERIGGILVRSEASGARVCGCAYDVSLSDGAASYSATRAIVWAYGS